MDKITIKEIIPEKIEINEVTPEPIEVKEVYVRELKTVTIEKTINQKGLNGKDGKDWIGKNGKDGKTPTKTELKALIKEVFPEDKLIQKVISKMPKEEIATIEIGEDQWWQWISKGGKKMYIKKEYNVGAGISTGVYDFIALRDAPSSYTWQAWKIVKVKTDETGLEFGTWGGGGGSVESVTGLNTDNTDPANPIVQISVDGLTITGAGTPWSPLTAVTGGSGDVTWPASSVDDRIATFDGTTGKIIQDWGVKVSDLATASQWALADTAVQPAWLTNYFNKTTDDTDDITDTATNRFTNDTDITRLANTSGTNTGDQDLSGLVPYTGATTDVNLGTYDIITDTVRASTSAGLLLESANGTDIGLSGVGNSANMLWYGAHNFSLSTQDTIAGFLGVGKTLSSLSTATYPSLTELSYVKGVTSTIQTQLDGKVDKNAPITGATKTKITYDAKGLVTAWADATTADISDSSNRRYVTDAQQTIIAATTASFTTADETKLDLITVTQPVDLDTMEADIAALANGMVYKGNWDASAGTFPGGWVAQTGWFYTVSVWWTVDSVVFNIDDRLVATTDNASTTTYAWNWTKLDATDAVTSVFSRTGNVVSANGDYTASQVTNVPAGGIAATDVQTALNELDTEKFTLPSLTAGSILFSDGSTISQDNANLFYDNTNDRLWVHNGGTPTPQTWFHVWDSTNLASDIPSTIVTDPTALIVGKNNEWTGSNQEPILTLFRRGTPSTTYPHAAVFEVGRYNHHTNTQVNLKLLAGNTLFDAMWWRYNGSGMETLYYGTNVMSSTGDGSPQLTLADNSYNTTTSQGKLLLTAWGTDAANISGMYDSGYLSLNLWAGSSTAKHITIIGTGAETGYVGIGTNRPTAKLHVSGTLLSQKLVEANTAGSGSPNIITSSESGTLYTNEWATALNYHTLPTASAWLTYTFYVDDADWIRITANTGDIIQINGVASASAWYAECTAIGGCLTLTAINATDWVATSVIWAWSLT